MSLVLLDHLLSYVLNKNPPLVISADPERVASEHRGSLLHVQVCTEKASLGGTLPCCSLIGKQVISPPLH